MGKHNWINMYARTSHIRTGMECIESEIGLIQQQMFRDVTKYGTRSPLSKPGKLRTMK